MTPDLEARIDSEALTADRIRSIVNASKDTEGLLPIFTTSRWTLRGRRYEPRLDFDTFHDYLSESADWDDPTWKFEASGLLLLRLTLIWLFRQLPERLSFQAVWVGDPIEEEREVGRDELLDLITADKIGTKTRYWVAPDATLREKPPEDPPPAPYITL